MKASASQLTSILGHGEARDMLERVVTTRVGIKARLIEVMQARHVLDAINDAIVLEYHATKRAIAEQVVRDLIVVHVVSHWLHWFVPGNGEPEWSPYA